MLWKSIIEFEIRNGAGPFSDWSSWLWESWAKATAVALASNWRKIAQFSLKSILDDDVLVRVFFSWHGAGDPYELSRRIRDDFAIDECCHTMCDELEWIAIEEREISIFADFNGTDLIVNA